MEWVAPILGSGLVAGIVTGLINHLSSRANARHLEQFRAELSKELTRFSSLQQARGEVIAEVYRLLRLAEADFADLTARLVTEGEPTQAEKWQAFGESANAFTRYFQTKRIFLDEWLCCRIDRFQTALRHGAVGHQFWGYENMPSEDKRDCHREVEEAKKTLAEVRRELEKQFRLILGVSDAADFIDESNANLPDRAAPVP